ncbi:uncharacterized protein LOC132205945 isoform X2 [Neocloeon triangulifer]|uniref:uncharacterized protein LOC132205945 isoform X2 n=1 Tax=Neocloeon triangulifer TaxID=2078957 RepID=UPI00286FA824|nr:uncharacterized protein LOC132205945 isoform X2 [Neocloeon triangulifer]
MKVDFTAFLIVLILCFTLNCVLSFELDEPNEKWKIINFTDCWNVAENKSVLPGLVFDEQQENGSSTDCGKWDHKQNDTGPPWLLYMIDRDGNFFDGVIVSKKTIITYGFDKLRGNFKNKENIKIYGGQCDPSNNLSSLCFLKRNLLPTKVIKIKRAKLKLENFQERTIIVLEIQDVQFSSSLKPVCLWNRGNQNDASEMFFAQDHSTRSLVEASFLAEEKCFNFKISQMECDLYGSTICIGHEKLIQSGFLLIKRDDRFDLRAVSDMNFETRSRYFDLLPFFRKIFAESRDIKILLEISPPPKRIDFGDSQSFEECGKITRRPKRDTADDIESLPFIHNGNNVTTKGKDPWHASLTLHTTIGPIYDFCGATLISKRALVTAAHCLYVVGNKRIKEAQMIEVTLGMLNALEIEDSRQFMRAKYYQLHPKYRHRQGTFKNDIALIIVENDSIKITEFVKPLCLWNNEYELEKIINMPAKVVGWGLTEEHIQPNILQEASVKIVSYEECLKKDPSFYSYNLRPNFNFCAGAPETGTNPCKGDSGGGLVMYNTHLGRFFLRGVVSSGKSRKVILARDADVEEIATCTPDVYTLFTDVTSYIQWIMENAPDINKGKLQN